MPSAKVLEEKKQLVAELAEQMKAASSGVLVDYKGINVEDDTKLRADMRKNNVDYRVIKNTLIRFAAKEAGLEGLDDVLNGTTALAISADDVIAPAKVVAEYAKKDENIYNIKAGFIEGKVVSVEEIMQLANLPSKEILLGRLVGGLQGPIFGLALVLKAIADKKAEGAPEEAAEAPAEAAPVAEEAAAPAPEAPATEEAPAAEETPAE
ncbi:MAG: 50S ribosomal protein L10 [Oscillospiraceae bacterium]|nr:50S ribosomal protein L10 [Oscillospiraceae bacterium]